MVALNEPDSSAFHLNKLGWYLMPKELEITMAEVARHDLSAEVLSVADNHSSDVVAKRHRRMVSLLYICWYVEKLSQRGQEIPLLNFHINFRRENELPFKALFEPARL